MPTHFAPLPATDPDPDADLLMWDMVCALDIDLARAIRSHELPVATLSAMMRNCHACPEPEQCAIFLDRRGGRTGEAPSFCPNREKLAELRNEALKVKPKPGAG